MHLHYKNYLISVVLLIVIILLAPINSSAQSQPAFSEYEVKSAFILNIVKFIDWPAELPGSGGKTFNIYALGNDPMCETLDNLSGKFAKGKTVSVKRVNSLRGLKDPDIIFVCRSEKNHIGDIMRFLENKSVLTIGDTDGYARKGIIINFYMEMQKVRFEINVEAARQAKLRISSRLLNLSRIVHDMPPGEHR